MTERCQHLEQLLHGEVPLTRHIGMRVDRYDGEFLELHAALGPNVNIHGTAFGGSIYSMASLAGWGLLILKLGELGLDPRLMIAEGRITYCAPVMQRIRARSHLSDQASFDRFVAEYGVSRRARIDVPVEIVLDGGRIAATFVGTYAAFDR